MLDLKFPFSGNVSQDGWTNAAVASFNYGQMMGMKAAYQNVSASPHLAAVQAIGTQINNTQMLASFAGHDKLVAAQVEICDDKIKTLVTKNPWLKNAP